MKCKDRNLVKGIYQKGKKYEKAFKTVFCFCKNNVGKEIMIILKNLNFSLITIGKGGIEMDLQTRVREYLSSNGIKKKYLASLLGIYPTQLWQWLSGNYTLNNSQIKRIEDFLSGKS